MAGCWDDRDGWLVRVMGVGAGCWMGLLTDCQHEITRGKRGVDSVGEPGCV